MYPVRLDGQRIYLREVSVTDAVALQRVVGDPTVCETLIFEPKTLEETREYLASWEERAQAQPRAHYYLGAVRRDDDELVGAAYLGLVGVTDDETEHSGMLGGAMRPDVWGQDYATEAALLLMEFGFQTLDLQRIWGSCGPESPASIRLMEKIGLRYEARLREHRIAKGVWRDSLVYGLTKPDWLAAQVGVST
jgi:RimJ/RimL family protein N-acetyltransferase